MSREKLLKNVDIQKIDTEVDLLFCFFLKIISGGKFLGGPKHTLARLSSATAAGPNKHSKERFTFLNLRLAFAEMPR